jgi:hypothetical protein
MAIEKSTTIEKKFNIWTVQDELWTKQLEQEEHLQLDKNLKVLRDQYINELIMISNNHKKNIKKIKGQKCTIL